MSSFTLPREVLKIRSFARLIRAEMVLVYADFFRRKSLVIMYLAWPYISAAFMLMFGYSIGSPQFFVERVGVEPPLFLMVGSYLLFSIMTIVDDIMWRPIFDESSGVLPYVISSPTNVVLHYVSIPVPRFTLSIALGAAALLPISIVYRGFNGLLVSLTVVALSILSAVVFIPLATALGLGLYITGGENWRAINFLRPLLLTMTGVYYPRWLMSLPLYLLSSLLPPAHCVEVVQRVLAGMAELHKITVPLALAIALSILYSPGMLKTSAMWEFKKLREGVKV